MILLHGGPAASGYLSPVAKVLAQGFRVLEPFQRTGPLHPLKVKDHVADLEQVISHFCAQEKAALIGHSWGAMLALAYAAFNQNRLSSLVLVGCGTFDAKSRATMHKTIKERFTPKLQRQLDAIDQQIKDPDEKLSALGKAIRPLYCLDAHPQPEPAQLNARAHMETWQDMLYCQEKGIYPQAFKKINLPVIMLHGEYDPHPGNEIFGELKKFLPQLEFRQWQECGHDPWLEKTVGQEFYEVLINWLTEKAQS